MKSRDYIDERLASCFDVSVIMPFYKKMREFKNAFPNNVKYFQRRGIELIIVQDTDTDVDELISYVREYHNLNCKIIVNHKEHAWRNPAPVLNVGIKHSAYNYIMVCSPESEMLTDVIYLLRRTFVDYLDYSHFAYGRVCYVDQEIVTYSNYDSFRNIPFGSVMVKKSDLEFVRGYDETLVAWGGDDNNLRSRLNMVGVKGLFVEKAMMVHRDILNAEGKKRRTLSIDKLTVQQMRHFFYPSVAVANDEGWGNDFDDVVYIS